MYIWFHYHRRECGFEGSFKEDIIDLARSINKESQEVVTIAALTAEACTDRIMRNVTWLSVN